MPLIYELIIDIMKINKKFKKILLYIFLFYVIFLLIKLFINFIPSYDNFNKYINNYYNIVNYVLDKNIEKISYNNDKYCIDSDCNTLYSSDKTIINDLDLIWLSYLEVYNNKNLISIKLDEAVLIKLDANNRWYARDAAYFYKKWFFSNDNWVNILNNSNWHIRFLEVLNSDWAIIKID